MCQVSRGTLFDIDIVHATDEVQVCRDQFDIWQMKSPNKGRQKRKVQHLLANEGNPSRLRTKFGRGETQHVLADKEVQHTRSLKGKIS